MLNFVLGFLAGLVAYKFGVTLPLVISKVKEVLPGYIVKVTELFKKKEAQPINPTVPESKSDTTQQ